MKLLCYFIHADPSVRSKYENACKAQGLSVDFVFVNKGAFSTPYKQFAERCRDSEGRYLPTLMKLHPPVAPLSSYDATTMVTFSAGFGFLRDGPFQSMKDRDALDGVIAIDSWHAAYDPDGTAHDGQVAKYLSYALLAKNSPTKLCWIGHSDVRTPPLGHPQGYASTTDTAAEIVRLAGGTGGGFLVRAYNVRKDDHSEHIAALTEWGPDFVAAGLAELAHAIAGRQRHDTEPSMPVVGHQPPLGERALTVAIRELGTKEIPGPKHHPRILEYLSGCMRDGVNIGRWLTTDETPWCAAFASWCAQQALAQGEGGVPHLYRAAVRELWSDGIANSAAVAANRVRGGETEPRPGDLWVGTRAGGTVVQGMLSGLGHVARIEKLDGRIIHCLDGNHGNSVTRVQRDLADPEFVGVIRYPVSELQTETPEKTEPTDQEVRELNRLLKLSRDVVLGNYGLDSIPDSYFI